MEEDIKVLKEFIKEFDTDNNIRRYVSYYTIQAIENLIKGYKELKEYSDDLLSQNEMFKDMYDEEVYKNKELDKENTRQHELLGKIHEKYQKDYIPKSKVREIIEDIDNSQPVIAELKLRKLVEGDK